MEINVELYIYIQIINITKRVKFRIYICQIHLSKNLGIVMQLGRCIPWYSEEVDIQIFKIEPLPHNTVNRKI